MIRDAQGANKVGRLAIQSDSILRSLPGKNALPENGLLKDNPAPLLRGAMLADFEFEE
jgi:hypothetical protein